MQSLVFISGKRSASRALLSRVVRLAADESANALPEYAIVLASLSIIAYAAFGLLGTTSSNVVANNQNSFASTATQSFQR